MAAPCLFTFETLKTTISLGTVDEISPFRVMSPRNCNIASLTLLPIAFPGDFSKGRIDPLIQENPDTIGTWIKETDAANIKRVWNAFLYLRGMKSRAGLKSLPIDLWIGDEIDEAPQTSLDLAYERMSHSEFRELLLLSNPTLPDFGIDKAFQQTDQRYWLLKCEKCGESTCLEDDFPDCLLEVEGRVIRACSKCKRELSPAIGEWVAKKPSITDKRGYHYSQLFSQFVDPSEILHQHRTTSNLQDFWNLKIGIPWIEAENRLTILPLRFGWNRLM